MPVAGNLRADTLLATSIKNAASIAKGRVLVDLGRFSDAAAAVAGVPTSYTYNVTFSQATNDNNVWGLAGQVSTRARFVVGDSFDTQGITKNALPFSSAKDPRVPTIGSPTANGTKSIDGITPLVSQQIWLNRSDPIPVATGIDARLIEAEAKLNANDIAGMMTILNALRTAPQTLGPLRASRRWVRCPARRRRRRMRRRACSFEKRRSGSSGAAMRLGDLRRLIRQYGRTEDQVFPIGKFHKAGGASYGTDVNLPVTDNEQHEHELHGVHRSEGVGGQSHSERAQRVEESQRSR